MAHRGLGGRVRGKLLGDFAQAGGGIGPSSPDGDTVTVFATISATNDSRKMISASLSSVDKPSGSGGNWIVVRGQSGEGEGWKGLVRGGRGIQIGIEGPAGLRIDQRLRRRAARSF